jgi:RNA polymerase sigma-70 factor (ECF subfamily)
VVRADDESYAEVSVQDTIEKMETNTALIDAVREAYKKLPARCRKVIDLKYYQGLTTEEIALQTGLTKRSVYNNLFEGIKLLSEELKHATPGIRIAALLSALAFVTLYC